MGNGKGRNGNSNGNGNGDRETNPIPTLDKVDHLYLAIGVESIIQGEKEEDLHRARKAVEEYFGWREDEQLARLAEYVSLELDEPEESEYGIDDKVFYGEFFGTVTVQEWLRIQNHYCLDLDWVDDSEVSGWRYRTDDLPLIPAIPDRFEETMGILGPDGLIPAVNIPYTDEGWGEDGYEPALIASFYVAIAVKEEEEA